MSLKSRPSDTHVTGKKRKIENSPGLAVTKLEYIHLTHAYTLAAVM